MIADQKSRRVGGFILAGIAAVEGTLVVVLGARNPIGFATYLGFAPGRTGAPAGWILANAISAVYVGFRGVRGPRRQRHEGEAGGARRHGGESVLTSETGTNSS